MNLRQMQVMAAVIMLFFPSMSAYSVTKKEIMSVSVKVADRLASVKQIGRGWEDLPFLTGTIRLAGNLEAKMPDSGKRFLDRARIALGSDTSVPWHGDDAGYAQVALELFRNADAVQKAELMKLVEGPFAFAKFALRATRPDKPRDPWWVDGGFGTRFWQDDLFTMPPWLAMLCSTRDGLPGDQDACRLAHEWIESYVFDHRPASLDPREHSVPSERERGLPFLWDEKTGLFWHDPVMVGSKVFWGRGNGWVAYGLVEAEWYLDAPYSGDRYETAMGRPEIKALLARMADTLRTLRTPDGGWPSDLLDPSACNVAETSATGLITYMIARGVNEGWLDHRVYAPIAKQALALLFERVDAEGNVRGIQPPGAGPDCYTVYSDNPEINVNYGAGAVLLAAQEVHRCLIKEEFERKKRQRDEMQGLSDRSAFGR